MSDVISGKNGETVINALSGCNSFQEVKALGVLFHGTCEDIKGDLQGGGYDNVFWTATQPSVAQAYIPKAGIWAYYYQSDEYDRERPLQPDQNDSVSMLWAMKKESYDVFSSPETPEFITFMKQINPSYLSAADIANLPENRTYVVMTDSHRPYDKSILARKMPSCSKEDGFWTDSATEDVWVMDRETAEEVLQSLRLNNPRMVRSEKALKIISDQRAARLEMAQLKVKSPFEPEDLSNDAAESPEI